MIGNKSIGEIMDNQSSNSGYGKFGDIGRQVSLEHLQTVFYNETGYSVVNNRLKFYEWVDKNYLIVKKK
jgi:hypothetical protein